MCWGQKIRLPLPHLDFALEGSAGPTGDLDALGASQAGRCHTRPGPGNANQGGAGGHSSWQCQAHPFSTARSARALAGCRGSGSLQGIQSDLVIVSDL